MQTTPLAAPGPDAAELEQRWQQQGFTLWPSAGQFVPAIARVFAQRIEGGVLFRWLATPAHCNGGGIVHGGMLSTLADTWLANNVLAQLPAERRMVTTNLAVDFLRPVWPGQVLECAIDRVKIGSRLCHISGVLLVEQEAVVAMRATFALIPPTGLAAPVAESAAPAARSPNQ
ncbi:hypothetical protein JCM19000A_41410 [Silvimonas sp. JCM 19000]